MDFRNVTGLTIPEGNVAGIKIGNLSIWSKSTGNKYKILKNGAQVAEVTMSNFVKSVQSGDAQTDWGIGAQIVIPYTDPFDNNKYELPFNFGTFTACGNGKLGLQTHYAVPSQSMAYGEKAETTSGTKKTCGYCHWHNSNAYKWLNTNFLTCLPEDFINTIQDTPYYGPMASSVYTSTSPQTVNSKFFFPSANNMYISSETVEVNGGASVAYGYNYGISSAHAPSSGYTWEYWKDGIGTASGIPCLGSNVELSNKSITGQNVLIITADAVLKRDHNSRYSSHHLGISGAGKVLNCNVTTLGFFLPACAIG